MIEFPRLRWLLLLLLSVIIAGIVETGSVLDALQSASVQTPGIVSLVLFTLRAAQAYSQIDTDDEFVHTMASGRRVKQPGLWELVW